MKKGYWVVSYRTVGDEAMMSRYVALARAALGPLGAHSLVPPGSAVTAHEAGLKQATVVVEFDSYEAALAAYESEDYKKALAVLGLRWRGIFRLRRGLSFGVSFECLTGAMRLHKWRRPPRAFTLLRTNVTGFLHSHPSQSARRVGHPIVCGYERVGHPPPCTSLDYCQFFES